MDTPLSQENWLCFTMPKNTEKFTFSIVFTNKKRVERNNPNPHQKEGQHLIFFYFKVNRWVLYAVKDFLDKRYVLMNIPYSCYYGLACFHAGTAVVPMPASRKLAADHSFPTACPKGFLSQEAYSGGGGQRRRPPKQSCLQYLSHYHPLVYLYYKILNNKQILLGIHRFVVVEYTTFLGA